MGSRSEASLDTVAANWVARLDRGPLSNEEQIALDAWLTEDVRHHGAFARLHAISVYSERAAALGSQYDPDDFLDDSASEDQADAHFEETAPTRELLSRRRVIKLGAAIAAAACAAGLIGVSIFDHGKRYDTRIGETRVVSLEDGSVITLNTASEVKINFSPTQRFISLIRGEVLFDVAKDQQRPFVVEAGGATVRAVGTSFTVRKLADAPVGVLVREGIVEARAYSNRPSVRLTANMRAEIEPDTLRINPVSVTDQELDRELVWREGRIAIEGKTLQDAALEFSRYSDTRIIIDDPAIQQEEITGLFAANDPVTFARAAALSLGLRTQVSDGQVRIIK